MSLNYIVAMLLITLGFYCLLFKRNLMKLVIGLAVMTDGIHLFLISMGYRAGGISPIFNPEVSPSLSNFVSRAVDPLPQALVLTSIVINICITAMALSFCIYAYRRHGTLNSSEIRELKE
jgi:multicomponent Na+:H+ antiporter subunit C